MGEMNRYKCAHCDWEATVGHVVKHYYKHHPGEIGEVGQPGGQCATFRVLPLNGLKKEMTNVYCCLACRKFWRNKLMMAHHFEKCPNKDIHQKLLSQRVSVRIGDSIPTPSKCSSVVSDTASQKSVDIQVIPKPKQTIAENIIVKHSPPPPPNDETSPADRWKEIAMMYKHNYEVLVERYNKLREQYIAMLWNKFGSEVWFSKFIQKTFLTQKNVQKYEKLYPLGSPLGFFQGYHPPGLTI